MAIVTHDPFRNMRTLQHEINRLFDSDRDRADGALTAWHLPVDIMEDEDKLVIRADIPGMRQEEIKVNVENNNLTISGERRSEVEREEDHYHRVERSFGRFSRTFQLPNTTDLEQIRAEYKNGVLEISLPKRPEAKPRAIEVQVH